MGLIASVFQNLIDLNENPFAGMPPFQYEASTSRQGSHQNEREQPNAHSLKRSLSSVSSDLQIPGQGHAKRTRRAMESTPGQNMNSMSVNQGIHRSTRSQPDANVAWTLTPHGEQAKPLHKVLLEFDKLELVAVLQDSTERAVETISLEALKEIASVIDDYAYSPGDYREILNNDDYREIRAGSVCLNSSGAFAKCIPASVRLPSELMTAR